MLQQTLHSVNNVCLVTFTLRRSIARQPYVWQCHFYIFWFNVHTGSNCGQRDWAYPAMQSMPQYSTGSA